MDERRREPEPARTALRARRAAHLWIPACLSGLLLIAFFPLILRLQPDNYRSATGHPPPAYLLRWLAFSAALFVASGILYAAGALRRHRNAGAQPADRLSA